ncbi:MAG TPA: Ku protein [Chloroflexi bacterium]|jgi:DNA end-binding protein Ku|nr:Ku protein [Chloroflexota bacterium]
MRPMWTGSLSFMMVNIPVRVYSAASEENKIKFSMLHEKDLSPIGYAKYCKLEGTEVDKDEIVKGYEYAKDQYVVLTDEELAKANQERTKRIKIEEFVDPEEIDPSYYEKPYYLEPEKEADVSYALLSQALQQTKKVGIARFVIRNRDYIAVVRSDDGLLVLNQLRFSSEVRSSEELRIPEVKVDERDLDVAKTVVAAYTHEFEPAEFHDTYAEEIRRVIDAKLEGKEPEERGEVPKATAANDLMKMLKASLDQAKQKDKVA